MSEIQDQRSYKLCSYKNNVLPRKIVNNFVCKELFTEEFTVDQYLKKENTKNQWKQDWMEKNNIFSLNILCKIDHNRTHQAKNVNITKFTKVLSFTSTASNVFYIQTI